MRFRQHDRGSRAAAVARLKRRRVGLWLASLLAAAVLVTGCAGGAGKSGARPKAPLRPAEVRFSSGGEVMTVYLEDATVTPMTGGITQTPYYDASGNVLGYFNYARVNYIRWLQRLTP